MYVVRCKKRDALPQPRAEIRQFRTELTTKQIATTMSFCGIPSS